MRDFNWYVDTAKQKNNIKSNNKLALELNITGAALSILTQEKSVPSPETMVKISKLAGVEPSIALAERSVWMSTGEPKKAYTKILHSLQRVALSALLATAVFMGSSNPSSASQSHLDCQQDCQNLYIMEL